MRRHVPLNTIKREGCRLVGDTVTHTPTGKWFRAYPGMPDICLENMVDTGEYSECELRQMAALVLADRLKRKSDPLAPALAPGIAIKEEADANATSGLKARGGVGAWGFAHKGSIFVEDRRFLIELFASVILMVTYIVLASIRSEEARRPEQYLGRSGDSQIKAAPTTASSSGGAQSQGEERLASAAEKKRQEEAAARNEAERLALEAEKKPVSADLPIFAPSRVVLTYPRNDEAAAERTTALRQALTATKVEVVKVEAVDASRPTPGIGYYFRSDHEAAVDVSHRVQPLLGPVEPALLELRGKVPPPGTVEIAVPGRGAR